MGKIESDGRTTFLYGFYVRPRVYGAGNTFMNKWIEYIATGIKPEISEFELKKEKQE